MIIVYNNIYSIFLIYCFSIGWRVEYALRYPTDSDNIYALQEAKIMGVRKYEYIKRFANI